MLKNYLYTIGKYLSPKQREEVLKEIEASLYDYLEENFGKKSYSDAELESAIRAMGHPKKVAEAYLSAPRSVIGPAFIDIYWLIVKIAIIGSVIGVSIGLIFETTSSTASISSIANILGSIWNTGLSAFGMVTLIFILVQRFNPDEAVELDENWSLSLLEKAPEKTEKVNFVELVIESVFICVALVFLNQVTPFFKFIKETTDITIIHIELMKPMVYGLSAILISNLFLNIFLLIRGQWQTFSRAIMICIDLASIVFAIIISRSTDLWNISIISNSLNTSIAEVEKWFYPSINITIAIAVIIICFDIFGHVRSLLRMRK